MIIITKSPLPLFAKEGILLIKTKNRIPFVLNLKEYGE
jgi:hypothetical protein